MAIAGAATEPKYCAASLACDSTSLKLPNGPDRLPKGIVSDERVAKIKITIVVTADAMPLITPLQSAAILSRRSTATGLIAWAVSAGAMKPYIMP